MLQIIRFLLDLFWSMLNLTLLLQLKALYEYVSTERKENIVGWAEPTGLKWALGLKFKIKLSHAYKK